jgi:glycosyltransferase involved in cell wall biosynthesis
MARRKVLYIISNVTDSTEYELLVKYWDRDRFDLEFVLLNREPDCTMQQRIRAAGYPCTTYIYLRRSQAIGTVRTLMRHLRSSRPDVINCNLLEASVYGLLAAFLTGIGRRIYTRHLAAHNHKYHPVKGVLYDRFCNALAHRIIAISTGTQEVLTEWEGVPARKVVMIHHGYELDSVHAPDPAKLARLRHKHGMDEPGVGPVIGIISRPFRLKGLDQSIPALGRLLDRWPQLRTWFFNWKPTPQSDHFDALMQELPASAYRTVHFEPEVVALYHAFDVFIHVPEDKHAEAYGMVYIEAAMAGVPCVFTRSGVMHDLDPTRMAGITVVPFQDAEAITRATAAWLERAPTAVERASFAATNIAYLRDIIDIRQRMRTIYELYENV